MVTELGRAFKGMLKETEWMDEITKKKALNKIEEMISLVGYPDFIRSNKELDNYYKLVSSSKTNFSIFSETIQL